LSSVSVPVPALLSDRLARVAHRSTLRLTHYGRKTGRPYHVTVWFAVDGDSIYLTTMNRGRQWVRNAMKTPRVQLQIGAESVDGTIAPVTELTEKRRVYALLSRKYWVMWLLDRVAALVGQNPRRGAMDLGRGGFFRVQAAPGRAEQLFSALAEPL